MRYEAGNDALPFDEGDEALLLVRVARANRHQALIEFLSTGGPYSIRVPVDQLTRVIPPG